MGKIKYLYQSHFGKEIIIREFYGEMTVEEIIASFEYLQKNKISDKCIGLMTDTSNSILKFDIQKLKSVLDYLKDNRNIYEKIKLAIIVDTPKKTVLPTIAAKALPFLRIKPFSNRENALKWIIV